MRVEHPNIKECLFKPSPQKPLAAMLSRTLSLVEAERVDRVSPDRGCGWGSMQMS